MLVALPLLAALTLGDWPRNDTAAPGEDAALGPLEVCNAMTAAVKRGDLDAMMAHTTGYARTRFSERTKIALKGLHSLLIGVRCVRVDQLDDKATPARAMIWVYAPENKSRDMPFVKENGFWRYDQQRYEELHKKKD